MTATTAGLEERAADRLERARRVTYRTFLFSGILVVVLPLVTTAADVRDGELPAGLALAAGAGLACFVWIFRRLVRAGLEGGAERRDLVLGGGIAAVLTLLMPLNPIWVVIGVQYAATAALSLRSLWSMALLCAGSAVVCAWSATAASASGLPLSPRPWLVVVFLGINAAAIWINRYQLKVWYLHQEAHAARDALARLAVTEERLRFSRDLHDLLGHRLSLIAVKSELAIRLADDPATARAEMADVRSAAREALREVRAAVRGYRAADLDAELAGVRAVLEATGIDCSIARPPSGLGPEAADALAWVVREGATNVIKHSSARHCTITFTSHGGALITELTNDGVPAPRPRPTAAAAQPPHPEREAPKPKSDDPDSERAGSKPEGDEPGSERAGSKPEGDEPGARGADSKPEGDEPGAKGADSRAGGEGSRAGGEGSRAEGEGSRAGGEGSGAESVGSRAGGEERGAEGAGSGLMGLRERLAAVRGTLSAGPDGRGGFILRATLPAPAATHTAATKAASPAPHATGPAEEPHATCAAGVPSPTGAAGGVGSSGAEAVVGEGER